jgi:hypothetical protein
MEKMVLYICSGAILIGWYPENLSVNEYASCPPTLSNTSSVKGVQNGSCRHASFSFLKSTHTLIPPFSYPKLPSGLPIQIPLQVL